MLYCHVKHTQLYHKRVDLYCTRVNVNKTRRTLATTATGSDGESHIALFRHHFGERVRILPFTLTRALIVQPRTAALPDADPGQRRCRAEIFVIL